MDIRIVGTRLDHLLELHFRVRPLVAVGEIAREIEPDHDVVGLEREGLFVPLDSLVDAANLEQRYGRMLTALEAAGTKVVRYVGKRARALETAFDSVGLRVLGPSEAQLLLCAKAITDATSNAIRVAKDMLARDDVPDPIDAYRRLVLERLGL